MKKLIEDNSAFQMKRFAFLGMSGLGKTFIARNLVRQNNWSHFSVDYEIGKLLFTDKYKDLLEGFSVENLTNLSKFLGKPGSPSMGGIPFSEYVNRQKLHRAAEIKATLQVCSLIENSPNLCQVVCDTSGSICEIVDPLDKNDRILTALSKSFLIICLEAPTSIYETLIKRFISKPKPMYYQESFLTYIWQKFKSDYNKSEHQIDPDEFTIYGYKALIQRRKDIFNTISENWGITLNFEIMSQVSSGSDLVKAIELQMEREVRKKLCQ